MNKQIIISFLNLICFFRLKRTRIINKKNKKLVKFKNGAKIFEK